MRWVSLLVVLAFACGDDSSPMRDVGVDASRDAGIDGGDDAGSDGAPMDVGVDASAVDGGDDARVSMPCSPPGECDPFLTDSCPADEVCVTRDTGRTECRRATDTAGLGDACTRMEDCSPGLMCVNVAGTSTCHQSCPEGSIGFCGGENRCIGSIGDACVRFCRLRPPPCDIYMQDCPEPGDACTFATDPETDEFYTGCRAAGPNDVGEPCGGDDGFCMAGSVCIRREGVATCHEVCDASLPMDTCGVPGEACEGLSSSWRVTYCRPSTMM